MPALQRIQQILYRLFTPRRCLLLVLILFTAMIAIGSIPGKADALSSVVYDKLLHMLAYGMLAGLIYCGISGNRIARALCSVLAIAALGAADEAIQSLMPYRHANLQDWKFNMLGAFACVTFLSFRQPMRSQQETLATTSMLNTEEHRHRDHEGC
jgi:VanZ family protein